MVLRAGGYVNISSAPRHCLADMLNRSDGRSPPLELHAAPDARFLFEGHLDQLDYLDHEVMGRLCPCGQGQQRSGSTCRASGVPGLLRVATSIIESRESREITRAGRGAALSRMRTATLIALG